MKKLLTLFVFLFIPLIAILFVQCSEPVIEPTDQNMVLSLNKGGDGGGEVEAAGNNLSFPALLADGYPIIQITEEVFGVPYDGPYTDLSPDQLAALVGFDWYAQKVYSDEDADGDGIIDKNVWQAEYATYDGTPVTFIDWGDMMESVDAKVRTPYRVEFGFYVELPAPMSAYTMALLASPSSLDEVQGTNGDKYDCGYATIASPLGKCIIQRYDDGATLTWDPAAEQWEANEGYVIDDPLDVSFGVECNVGGKFIFGASTGGFKPDTAGEYRITFYFEEGSTVSLDAYSYIGDYNGGDPIPKEGERNTAVVDWENNLTYMDVTAIDGGRSGSESGGEDGDGDGDGDGGDHEGDGNNGTGGE